MKSRLCAIALSLFIFAAPAANAALVSMNGFVTASSGLLSFLVPVGAPLVGEVDYAGINATSVRATIANLCFTDDANGSPATGSCPFGGTSIVPILDNGVYVYTGSAATGNLTHTTPAPPLDISGLSDFEGLNGTGGLTEVVAFSPTAAAPIPIDFIFFADGTGTFATPLLDPQLGAVAGEFEWLSDTNAPPVPIPAAVWLFASALFGLGLNRRRKS